MFHHILSQTCLKPYIQDQLHIELCMNIFELVIQTKTTYKNIRSQFIFGNNMYSALRSNVAYPFQNSLYLQAL
jgi:FPC/CPF motif-containing protein YcgG